MLLGVLDIGMLFGLCDCMMFELMYVSGLCVSEFVMLKIVEVGFNEGVVCVMGKGLKEWFVLFGEVVYGWIECYLCDVWFVLFGVCVVDVLFVIVCGDGMMC